MKPIYAYYGDDFTGSTDVLEQLAEGGVPSVLFLRAPDEALRARFPEARAIGLAGDSRSRAPEWMDENLPAAFSALAGAEIVHYKTCSTFDSSPETGSIGRAMDIGLRLFGGPAAIVVGAPHLGRYVAFGNLFATCEDRLYRIDRHPTMSRHPVTPMHEADLVRHLAAQTATKVALVPIDAILAGRTRAAFDKAESEAPAILFDAVSTDDLAATGEVLTSARMRFAVGSSGLTRALVLAWRARGLVDERDEQAPAAPLDRLLVVSGSCSPVTASQIARAKAEGYVAMRADVAALVRGEAAEEERLIGRAASALQAGERCVIYTSNGDHEPTVKAAGAPLGSALGRVTSKIIHATKLTRLVFAGGDTSSHGVVQLGIDALTWAARLEPGAPLVRAHAEDSLVDGLELVLKGGQIGGEDFFESARLGRRS